MLDLSETEVCDLYYSMLRASWFVIVLTFSRKKCDESFPVCLKCKQRNKECTWPTRKRHKSESDAILMLTKPDHMRVVSVKMENVLTTVSPNSGSDHITSSTPMSSLLSASIAVMEGAEVLDCPTSDLGDVERDLMDFKEDLKTFQMELEEQKNLELLDEQLAELQKEFLIALATDNPFRSAYLSKLDADGLRYLEVFDEYCTFISLSTRSLNYLRITYGNLATKHEPILYAISAMGGFFQDLFKPKGNFSIPWLYMQRSAKLMCNLIGNNLKLNNKEDFIVLFAFYLIFISIEVCTGDVRNWGGLLHQCWQLIKTFGGLAKVAETFNNSNDIKWLMYNFQYHDILSSRAFTQGTMYSIDEYRAVLPEDPNYGIDPLHGIATPVYYIFGEIGNAQVKMRKKWATIEEQLRIGGEGVHELRIEYYEELEQLADSFTEKIEAVSPWNCHLHSMKLDQEEYEMQMGLFDLYVYICQMQLNQGIRRLPASSPCQQLLLRKAVKLIDILILTRAKVALSLLILLCGMTCVTQLDRDEMIQRFRKHLNQYQIGNFLRVEELVEHVWKVDPHGRRCLDWAQLADQKGWYFYVG